MKPDKVHCEPCGWEALNIQDAIDRGLAFADMVSGACGHEDFIICYECLEPLSVGPIDPAMKEV